MLVYPIGIQTLRNTARWRIFQMQVFQECSSNEQTKVSVKRNAP